MSRIRESRRCRNDRIDASTVERQCEFERDFLSLLGERNQSGTHVLSHQSSFLMLKDVTMIHERVVARCRPIEGNEKLRAVLDKHYVLPAREMRRRRCSFN